jgi:hypothetical protein
MFLHKKDVRSQNTLKKNISEFVEAISLIVRYILIALEENTIQ